MEQLNQMLRASSYHLVGKAVGFAVLLSVTHYVYLRGISDVTLTDATALVATNVNFAYVWTWIVLQKQFVSTRVSSR